MRYEGSTVRELHDALLSGATTPMDLLAEARRVIQEKDGDINAFVEVFDTADEDARLAHEMIRAGRATPLTGIPIAIKDNLCISGRTVTACSGMLRDFVAPYDATVITQLRSHGSVIVGRTNMDEFAMGSSTEHSVYGPTKNPHDTNRVPGGSSGGSAAAVAMGAVPLAIGSDTGGSIRQPASFCGVVGLKPTYGALSRHGLIALGSSLDVVGVLARSAEDAQLCFEALHSDGDGFDSTVGLFADSRSPAGEGIVLGVPENLERYDLSPETLALFTDTVRALESDGYTVRSVPLPLMEQSVAVYYIIQPAEASSNLARFDGMRYGFHADADTLWGGYLRTRSDGFGEEVQRRIVVGTYVLSAGYYDAYYVKAAQARQALRESLVQALREVNLIVVPTSPDTAFVSGTKQDPLAMYAEDRLTLQANLTGLPALSVPMRTDGLPRGIQCIGGYGRESDLFAFARSVESQ